MEEKYLTFEEDDEDSMKFNMELKQIKLTHSQVEEIKNLQEKDMFQDVQECKQATMLS